ncbi:MAG TPA: hypothetical protein VIZ86_16605 [Pseudomonas sp.]
MRDTICSSETKVTFDEVTMTAYEWAALRKIKWQTVKMRRYRGASWGEALRAGRTHNRWIAGLGAFKSERSATAPVAGPH